MDRDRIIRSESNSYSPREGATMKFGIMFANTGRAAIDGSVAAGLARAAEKSGFESIWTVEHVVVPSGYASTYPYDESGKMGGGQESFDITDPLVWLSYVAAATESIRLATGILILPQRNPAVLAKAVATLDRLSGGRMMLGVGVGWLEEEFDALGVPFARRGARTDDSIRALRSLWSEECSTYDGEFFSFRNVYSRPQPETGSVPIIVGGHLVSKLLGGQLAGRIDEFDFHIAFAKKFRQMLRLPLYPIRSTDQDTFINGLILARKTHSQNTDVDAISLDGKRDGLPEIKGHGPFLVRSIAARLKLRGHLQLIVFEKLHDVLVVDT